MRPTWVVVALWLALGTSGCITLNERSIDHDFPGLRAAMARSGTVSMLLVHGMGGYSAGDPQALTAAIQSQLRLRPTSPPQTRPVPDRGGAGSTLARQDFVSPAGRVLRIYTLQWEPLTEDLKKQYLAYDDAPGITRLRLPLHNDLKQSLMNGNIPDVVLYVGTYQRVLQAAVRFALRRMRADMGTTDDYEYFFVTFSLGSKIVFDVVDETDNAPDSVDRARIVDKTASFFMLANQIPLLGLGSVSPSTRPSEPGYVPGYESMLRFVRRKHGHNGAPRPPQTLPASQPAGGGLSIVAVSDPNDLFSYTIPPYVKQQFPATFVNVQISVAKTGYWIPNEGYVANPMEAHTGYGHDPDVIKLIVEGGHATAAGR